MNSPPPDAGLFLREGADDQQTLLAFPTFRDVGGVIPRSGYTQQPGVDAQRRTPGYEIPERNAEGVLQPGGFHFRLNPTRIGRRCRSRTCDTTPETHPETIPSGGARAVSGCTPSPRRRVTGSRRTRHNPFAIETLKFSASTTSTIHVSGLAPAQRSRWSLRAGKKCERDPRYIQPGAMGCPVFGNDDLGCASARRPQANGCNRFAVLSRAYISSANKYYATVSAVISADRGSHE